MAALPRAQWGKQGVLLPHPAHSSGELLIAQRGQKCVEVMGSPTPEPHGAWIWLLLLPCCHDLSQLPASVSPADDRG